MQISAKTVEAVADDISTTKFLDKVWLQTITIIILYMYVIQATDTTLDECTSTYKNKVTRGKSEVWGKLVAQKTHTILNTTSDLPCLSSVC